MDELLKGLIEDLQQVKGEWNENYKVLKLRNEKLGLPFIPMKKTERPNSFAEGYRTAIEDTNLLLKREEK